jgi:hypothetical protein
MGWCAHHNDDRGQFISSQGEDSAGGPPQDFQDALLVTSKVGYRFIWIDSLCIVQDSVEDWEGEAICMADIYKHALVTIAAACAMSGDSGLLLPRSNSKAVEIPYYTGDGIHEDYFCATREVKPFTSEVDHGPLQTRAYILQARHPSHCTIHCGRTQLF